MAVNRPSAGSIEAKPGAGTRLRRIRRLRSGATSEARRRRDRSMRRPIRGTFRAIAAAWRRIVLVARSAVATPSGRSVARTCVLSPEPAIPACWAGVSAHARPSPTHAKIIAADTRRSRSGWSEQMPAPHRLGAEIVAVVGVGGEGVGHPLDHLDAVAGKGCHLVGIVGQ